MKKTYLYAIYFFPGDEQSMETLKLLRLLFRAIETGATLDRTNAMLTVNTNAAINLRENLSYVQMVVESMMQKSSADLDFCLQQKSVIEALEMRSQMQDQKVRELRLEMTSLEQCNENGELFQVLDCLGDVINEAQRLGTAMRESLCFYTGPYGSDSFKLQIYYRMVSSQRGLLLQFGVYVKAGPQDQCPFSKNMSIQICGIENQAVTGSIGIQFSPPTAPNAQLYPSGSGPFWIQQCLLVSQIQQVVKGDSFILSAKVEP